MDLLSTIPELRTRLASVGRVAFVPTMGNLHAGHIALVDLARRHGDCVVASIFVNPLQFGAGEDFSKYPRTLEADLGQLKQAGCEVVFTPDDTTLFRGGQTVHVEPPAIANELEGAHRPGHFRGVATIVAKLFNIVRPAVAVFGSKDYQQLHILRRMVEELDFDIEIVAGQTVRAEDGLALSSRNGYLSPAERAEAPRLFRVLCGLKSAIESGARGFFALENTALAELAAAGWQADYVSVRRQADLALPGPRDRALVALAAARLGNTRLIDNVEISLAV